MGAGYYFVSPFVRTPGNKQEKVIQAKYLLKCKYSGWIPDVLCQQPYWQPRMDPGA